jgi:hypothetical protein
VHGYNWCPKDLEKYKELTWREFLCTPDGEPSELWFEYVSYLKHKHTNERYIAKTDDIPAHYEKTFKFDNARKSVYNTLYQAERAFKEEVVELGVRCFDKYRNW